MANDWSDPSCVAVYNYESGALGTDSKGGNHLTVTGVSESAGAGGYKQGACAANFEYSESDEMYRARADMNSNFPLLYGTTNYSFTFCCWIKPESFSDFRLHFLWGPNAGLSVDGVCLYGATGNPRLALYSEVNTFAGSINCVNGLTAGQWYHIGATFDSASKLMRLRIWDDTAQVILENKEVTAATGALYLRDVRFALGAPASPHYDIRRFDGVMDEAVFFNRALSTADIDAIRQGNFASSSSSSSSSRSSSSSSSRSSSSSDSSSSSFVPLSWPTLSKGVEFDTREMLGAHDITMPLGQGQTKTRPRYTRRPHRWRLRVRLLTLADRLTLERFWLVDCERSKYTFEFLDQGMNQTWLVRWDPDEPVRFEHEERVPGKFRMEGVLLEDCAGAYGSGQYGDQYYDS